MDVTVGMSSTVERVFRKYYSELANAIDSPASFASDFYKEGLISQDSRDAASEVGNTRLTSDKAYQLLNAVQKMVKTHPEKVIPAWTIGYAIYLRRPFCFPNFW